MDALAIINHKNDDDNNNNNDAAGQQQSEILQTEQSISEEEINQSVEITHYVTARLDQPMTNNQPT
jgi:glutaredoxin 2